MTEIVTTTCLDEHINLLHELHMASCHQVAFDPAFPSRRTGPTPRAIAQANQLAEQCPLYLGLISELVPRSPTSAGLGHRCYLGAA